MSSGLVRSHVISLRLQGGKSDVWVAAVISARRQHDMFVMEPILVRVIRCLALAGTKTITRSTAHAKGSQHLRGHKIRVSGGYSALITEESPVDDVGLAIGTDEIIRYSAAGGRIRSM